MNWKKKKNTKKEWNKNAYGIFRNKNVFTLVCQKSLFNQQQQN